MINVNELYLQAKGKWKSLYGIYFDSTKSISQGRRLSKQLCVQSPKIQQLATAVGLLQLRNIIQPHKCYSRDYFNIGRLKVELVNDKGQPLRNNVPNKKLLLRQVGKTLVQMRKKK